MLIELGYTMAQIAILSDVHSNLPALTSVLREVGRSGAESVVFLGDIVGYGVHPAECVEWVRKLGGRCLVGNHEAALGDVMELCAAGKIPNWKQDPYFAGLVHSAITLSQDQRSWLAGLPYVMRIAGAVAAHGSLHEPQAFHYMTDAESAGPTLSILAQDRDKVGFFGHSHRQQVFVDHADGLEWLDESQVRIAAETPCAVTVGSVGQPRHETDTRAAWALWDPATRIVGFQRTEYDRLMAAQQIVRAGLPLESAMRLLSPEEVAFLVSK